MNEKLIELATTAGFTWSTSYREFSENGFINEKLAKFAELVREDDRKSRWLPIESAPKDRTPVWLFCPTHKRSQVNVGVYLFDDPRPFWSYSYKEVVEDRKNQPTHWMPQEQRPAPPQESEAQDD